MKYWGLDELPTKKKYSFVLSISLMDDIKAIAYCQRKQLNHVIERALELLIADATATVSLDDMRSRYQSFLKRHAPKF